jgi:hypothetical protein
MNIEVSVVGRTLENGNVRGGEHQFEMAGCQADARAIPTLILPYSRPLGRWPSKLLHSPDPPEAVDTCHPMMVRYSLRYGSRR